MKKILLVAVLINLLIINISSAFSQVVIDGIINNIKGDRLPYANIGIKKSKHGTVSTVEGKFNISIPNSLLNDSLTFSSIGFKDISILISSLQNQKSIEIVLEVQDCIELTAYYRFCHRYY